MTPAAGVLHTLHIPELRPRIRHARTTGHLAGGTT